MKSIIAVGFLLLQSLSFAKEAETLFVLRELKGEIQIYTAADGSLLRRPEKHEDGLSDAIYIQREKEDGKDDFYIAHNNGRTKVIPIVGEKSVTFVESYGDNNFLWTVCLDTKDKDGSFLVLCVRV